MLKKLRAGWILGLILIAYALYAGVFIYQSMFQVEGAWYSALFDDSMISMTYARNLARGDGLVWYPGAERIEGFSNPLWVGLIALIHLLPIPQRLTSLAVQVLGLIFFLASLVFLYRIGLHLFTLSRGEKARLKTAEPGSRPVLPALLAVLLTAFYYPLNNWVLLGTEVSGLLLIVTAGAWLALRSAEARRVNPWLYALLGLGILVRLDAAVPYLVIWGWLFLFDSQNRLKNLLWGGAMLIFFLGGQTAARYLYYGEWLPMTYYLKMTGMPVNLRLLRGLYTLRDFLTSINRWAFLFAFTALIFKRDRRWLLPVLLLLAQLVYSVYVGGDAWEHRGGANRFIALGMPFYFLLFASAGWAWMDAAVRGLGRLLKPLGGVLAVAGRIALVLACLYALLYANRYKNEGDVLAALRDPAEGVLRYSLLTQRSYFAPGSERYTRDGLALRDLTDPQASVAVTAAGNIIYYADRPGVDLFGKCDRVIALMPARLDLMLNPADPSREDILNLRPGHSKWRYTYSIGELKPDVVVEVFPSTDEEAAPFLMDYVPAQVNGHTMYFRRGSVNVVWEKVGEK